jgi:hypothetical protein
VDAHILKLKHRQNWFLHAVGNFDRRTPAHKMHMVFKIYCVYTYVIKRPEVIQNHLNSNVCGIG